MNDNRTWIAAGVLLAGIIITALVLYRVAEPPPEPRYDPPKREVVGVVPDTSRFVNLTLNPRHTSIDMFWKDEGDRDLRTLHGVRSYVQKKGGRLRFAMNGGMYHKGRVPVGLFIQNGRVLVPLDTSSGQGNFYLKPNGVFLVRKDRTAAIVPTTEFVYRSDIAFATQSGPMLLINGAVHPVFVQNSTHLNIRNGVGVRPDGTVLFAISREKISLYDFASYFRFLGCTNALYLDGFVSRCYLPEKNWEQLDGDFGVMIGVVE